MKQKTLFWKILGSENEIDRKYQKKESPEIREQQVVHKPKLYRYSTDENEEKMGELSVTEIENFSKKDLDSDDVMLLDCYDEVFVWLGESSSQEEKEQTLSRVREIIKNHVKDDKTFSNTESATTFVLQGFFLFYFILFFIFFLILLFI